LKFLKALVALLLLPAFASAWLFALEVARALDTSRVPWIPFIVFLLGISAWCLVHVLFPRPTWFYVLGHEFTHALAVLLSGGKVSGFRVSSEGGHVVSDRINAFIALSPYILPFYPLVLGGLWSAVVFLWPELSRWTILFLPLWGMSWGFHFAFTGSLLKTSQQDFESQGYFFSWTVILLANLWILVVLVTFWLRPFSFMDGLSSLAQAFHHAYAGAWNLLRSLKTLLS
jgi:hypothetical protein